MSAPVGETERALRALAKEWYSHEPGDKQVDALTAKFLPLFNAGIAGAYAAAAKRLEHIAKRLEESMPPEEVGALNCRQYAKAILALTPADALQAQPVIRCTDCGGTVIWKQTAEGYEVIHGCVNGKQARAAIASAEARAQTLLKALKKIRNLTGETNTEDYATRVIEDYEAGASTPDSTTNGTK